MSYERLNFWVRTAVGVAALIVIALTVIAARPSPRYYGSFPASLDTPQAIQNDWDIPAVYVTVSQPAVVSFPTAWRQSDAICMVVRYQRGTAAVALPFEDDVPQRRWDERPEGVPIIALDDISGYSPDGLVFRLATPVLYSAIEVRSAFRVHWLTLQSPILIYVDQPIERLLCYQFEDAEHVIRIPFSHTLRLSTQNTHATFTPVYSFTFANTDAPSTASLTTPLKKMDIESYLSGLVIYAPTVVQMKTALQISQRATETAFR